VVNHPEVGAAPEADLLRPARAGWRLSLPTDPSTILGILVTVWVLVPASVVRPKIGWALLAVALAVLLLGLWRHAARVRWSAPAALLLVPLACATIATPRHGSLADLLQAATTMLLLVGSALLAAHCDRRQTDRLVLLVLLVALLELGVGAASAFLGLPAPWGYLGQHGAVFGVNELLPLLDGRVTGTMAHPIPFGMLMATASALALFALPRGGWGGRLLMSGAFAGGVLLSGSRSAALVLLLSLLAGVFWPGVSRRGVPTRLAVLAGAVAGLFLVDVADLTAVSSLSGSGSLSHRLQALDAARRLLGRPADEVFLGSGAGSLRSLFAGGLLQQDGFFAVDNQVVTTFAVAGVIGVAGLLAGAGAGLIRGDRATRPAALVVVLMFFSFDVLEWTAPALLLAVLLGLGAARATGRPDGEADVPSGDLVAPGPRA
jgi:hypothetical protein